MGADGVCFHTGSHMGAGLEGSLDRIAAALEPALDACSGDTWLLIENTAGSGGTIGRSVDELATIVDRLGRHSHLGLCLDSCHLYASGYDITDRDELDRLLEDVDAKIGLDRLRLLHINDSKAPLGSNRDRHDGVLAGLMGERLGVFVSHPQLQGVPAVIRPAPSSAARARPTSRLCASYTRVGWLRADLGEDAEGRLAHGKLRELGIDAPELALASLVAGHDLGLAHR